MKIIQKDDLKYKLPFWIGTKLQCPNCHVIIQLDWNDHVTEIPGEVLGVINCPTESCNKQLRLNRDTIWV